MPDKKSHDEILLERYEALVTDLKATKSRVAELEGDLQQVRSEMGGREASSEAPTPGVPDLKEVKELTSWARKQMEKDQAAEARKAERTRVVSSREREERADKVLGALLRKALEE